MNAFDELIACVEQMSRRRCHSARIEPEIWADFRLGKSAKPSSSGAQSRTLEELFERIRNCSQCPLHQTRKQSVPGEGSGEIKLFFIGETPGLEDERIGRPFSGAPGELLSKMISAMQFSRSEVYLTTLVKCRAPEGAYPDDDHIYNCLEHLKEEIRLIKPLAIILLGEYPLRHLLNGKNLADFRQKWYSYLDIPTAVTYSPGYLMRNTKAKAGAWSDLQMVMKAFGKTPAK